MKTATLPPLRVRPEVRDAIGSVLEEGESLSSFVEQAVLDGIRRRQIQAEFMVRGMRAREDARRTGDYATIDDVVLRLRAMTDRASKASAGSR